MKEYKMKGIKFLCIETVLLWKDQIETDIVLYTKGNEYEVYKCGCLMDDLGELRDWFMKDSIASNDCTELRNKHFKQQNHVK